MSEIPKWRDRLESIIDEHELTDERETEMVEVPLALLKGINITLETYADSAKAQELYAEDLENRLEARK